MAKLIFYIFITFIFCGTVFGQGIGDPILRKPDGSVLLARVSAKDDDPSEKIIHTIENTADEFEKDTNALYAVRVCSTDPLPIAFADASGAALAVRQIKLQLDYLRNTKFLNIPESNIVILRNNVGCGFYKKSPITEYWFIPSSAELPEFIEIRNYDDITVNGLIFNFKDFDEKLLSLSVPEDATLTAKYYEEIKNKLVVMLKKDKTALLLIEVPQFIIKLKLKVVPSQAAELKLFLTRKGIGSHRIFIKNHGYYYQKKNSNTNFYPDVTIIYQK